MANTPTLQLTAGTLQEWHRWLQLKGRKERGVWLVFFRKSTGRTGLELEDARDEAICYGWIDCQVRRLDDERYAHLFTPRKDPKRWSEADLERLARMIEDGRMTRDGMAAVDRSLAPGGPPSN